MPAQSQGTTLPGHTPLWTARRKPDGALEAQASSAGVRCVGLTVRGCRARPLAPTLSPRASKRGATPQPQRWGNPAVDVPWSLRVSLAPAAGPALQDPQRMASVFEATPTMANLIITNACNLSCPFCFASEYLADGDTVGAERMELPEYRQHLAFLGDNAVRFCGGEPTTHPQFNTFVDLALEHPTRQVFLMTNGVWPDTVRQHLAALPSSLRVRVRFLFNILEPALYTTAQWNQLLATLGAIHPLSATLGLTLYKAPMAYAHVLELAKAFGVERIRFSVASPNVTDPRSWNLVPERDFPILAPLVHRLVLEARAQHLTVHSDCGYIPPCFFTAQQIEDLTTARGHPPAMQFSCEGPVDIGPGGEAWRCYGLFNVVRANTADHPDVASMAESFEATTADLGARHFMLDACPTCDWRLRGQCAGGCYAYRVTRTMQQDAGVVHIGEDKALLDVTPRVQTGRVRTLGSGPQARVMVEQDGTWVPLTASSVELDVLGRCNGATTVRQMIALLQADGAFRQPAPAVTRAVRKLFQQGAIQL